MIKTASLISRESAIKASFSSDTDNFNHLRDAHKHTQTLRVRLFINPALIRKVSLLRPPDASNINFRLDIQVLEPLLVGDDVQ